MEMLLGKNRILLFRKLSESDQSAAKLSFQIEHTFSYSRAMDRIVTKDGAKIKVGELESVVPLNALMGKDDPVFKMIQEAMIKGEKLELWEVTVDEDMKDEEGKYPAVYAQGYLDTFEVPANVEDEVNISTNFNVDLEPQFGFATLTNEQESLVQYAFRDVTPYNEGTGEDNTEGDTPD